MPTFAELTNKLSKDITDNEHERERVLAKLEADRVKALRALPGAAGPGRRGGRRARERA